MRPLKNTLFVQSQGAWLNKQGENVVMNIDYEVAGRVPIHKLNSIVCFGQVSISPALMAHCADNGITITHLNRYGKFQARIEGAVSGNVLLRREQYRISDDPVRTQAVCHSIVLGKVHNQRQVIRRYLRDYQSSLPISVIEQLDLAQKRLRHGLGHIVTTENLADLLGREGEMASYYFSVFPHFIRQDGFNFSKRTRPPLPMKSMLYFHLPIP